jgi:hypothetical protein
VPGLRFAIRTDRVIVGGLGARPAICDSLESRKKKTCAGTWMSGLRFGILSQEALIFVAHELGASNTEVAKLMGADSSLVSRRLDSAKRKMTDSGKVQKLVKLIRRLIRKVELKD